jgi:hypothetical protein
MRAGCASGCASIPDTACLARHPALLQGSACAATKGAQRVHPCVARAAEVVGLGHEACVVTGAAPRQCVGVRTRTMRSVSSPLICRLLPHTPPPQPPTPPTPGPLPRHRTHHQSIQGIHQSDGEPALPVLARARHGQEVILRAWSAGDAHLPVVGGTSMHRLGSRANTATCQDTWRSACTQQPMAVTRPGDGVLARSCRNTDSWCSAQSTPGHARYSRTFGNAWRM